MDERWEGRRDGGEVKRMDGCVHGWHWQHASATSDNKFFAFWMKCFYLYFVLFSCFFLAVVVKKVERDLWMNGDY